MQKEYSRKRAPGMQAKYVFLGGPPRSGTTLMQRILGLRPEIYAGREFDFVPPILKLRNRMRQGVRNNRISDFVSEPELDSHFRRFLGGILDEKLRKEERTIICEKSPSNAEVMPDILELFAEAKGLVMLRDPRDVVASLFSVGDRFKAEGKEPPRHCVDTTSAIQRYTDLIGPTVEALDRFPDRMRLVIYEDLVARPEMVTAEVFDFLGLDNSDEVMNLEDDPLVSRRDPSGIWHTREQLSRPISQDSVGNWKQSLSEDDLEKLETAFGGIQITSRYFTVEPKAHAGEAV